MANNAQRKVLVYGAAVIALMLLFPPFSHYSGSRGGAKDLIYSFLLSPPDDYGSTINVSVLLTQIVSVALICGLLAYAYQDKGKE